MRAMVTQARGVERHGTMGERKRSSRLGGLLHMRLVLFVAACTCTENRYACFSHPADGRCGLQAGLRSTRQGPRCLEEDAHASRSPERLSPSLRPSTVVLASASGIGSITLTTRNVARASLRARMTGAESLEPVPLAGLNLIAQRLSSTTSRLCRMQVLQRRRRPRVHVFPCIQHLA
jgi:hypothetical protein